MKTKSCLYTIAKMYVGIYVYAAFNDISREIITCQVAHTYIIAIC